MEVKKRIWVTKIIYATFSNDANFFANYLMFHKINICLSEVIKVGCACNQTYKINRIYFKSIHGSFRNMKDHPQIEGIPCLFV